MNIKWILLDVDGVLSDGAIVYNNEGQEWKAFNAQDGLGIAAARLMGYKLGIITGRTSYIVERRAKELKFDFLEMGAKHKSQSIRELCDREGISPAEIAYMGDDLNDLAPLSMVGLPLAPANGREEIKAKAIYVTQACGGYGAVREAIEYILKKAGKWEEAVARYAEETYANGQ